MELSLATSIDAQLEHQKKMLKNLRLILSNGGDIEVIDDVSSSLRTTLSQQTLRDPDFSVLLEVGAVKCHPKQGAEKMLLAPHPLLLSRYVGRDSNYSYVTLIYFCLTECTSIIIYVNISEIFYALILWFYKNCVCFYSYVHHFV